MNIFKALFALVIVFGLAGCATAPLSVGHYSSRENLETQTLAEGTVIRTMPITVADHQAQADNGLLGTVGGAAVGFAISSTPFAAIAGAVVGTIAGHELTPGHVNGTEVLVKLTDGQLLGVPEVGNPHLVPAEQVAIIRGPRGRTRAIPLNQQ